MPEAVGPREPGTDEAGTPDPAKPAASPPGAPRRPWLVPLTASAAALVLVVAALAFVVVHHRHQQQLPATLTDLRPSGIPPSVSTGLANMMGLSPVPAKKAPGFVLTDQSGRTLPLSSFRGKVVVLEAMDPHCVDICPIVSQEFVDAYHDLGPAASKVVFAAFNVNQYYSGVKDVLAFSQEQNLTSIPSWHFFTGSTPSLKAVWSAYGVVVQASNPKADILHTSVVYFIDPNGVERYIASPMADHTAAGKTYLPAGPLASWGKGIALVAQQLASSK